MIRRLTATDGPGDPERFLRTDRRVKRGVFPMFGSGRITYHPLYIDNRAMPSRRLWKGRGPGRSLLIADEDPITIEDLVKAVAKVMGQEVKIPHFPFWPLYPASFCARWFVSP